jgi:hypothetical protein
LIQHCLRKDAKSTPAVEPFVGLRFIPYSAWFSSSEMDLKPSEPAELEERARRAKAVIVIVMALFIAAPFVMYFIVGSHAAPTQ